jgi:hypothetical protein
MYIIIPDARDAVDIASVRIDSVVAYRNGDDILMQN